MMVETCVEKSMIFGAVAESLWTMHARPPSLFQTSVFDQIHTILACFKPPLTFSKGAEACAVVMYATPEIS
jgi:hypothetical protein